MTEHEDRLVVAQRRYELARAITRALVLIVALGSAGLAIAILISVRNTQEAIADCLQPGGACYQQSVYGARVRQTNAVNLTKLCAVLKVDCEPIPLPPERTPDR